MFVFIFLKKDKEKKVVPVSQVPKEYRILLLVVPGPTDSIKFNDDSRLLILDTYTWVYNSTRYVDKHRNFFLLVDINEVNADL